MGHERRNGSGSDHGPTKAEKRKADRAAVREAKKSAKLSRAQGIHANTVDDDEDNQIPTKVRAPLSYPVLNPRAASEQQLLLAQLSHQAPLAAIPVAAHQAQVQAAIPTPTPVAATQLNMQTEIAPNGVEPPLRNPFDTSEAPKKRGGGGSKKQSATAAAAMPQMPMLPFMGMAGMPPFMAQQAAFMQFTAEQQLQLQQQMMQQQQQHGASIPQHDGGNDEPAESLAAAPAAAAAAASSSSPSVAAVYAAAAAASSGQVAAAASSDAAAEPVDPAVQDIIAGNLPSTLTSAQLNSDDDDSDDDAAVEADDIIVCQYEKIAHLKDRWKIVLKDGIIRVNKRDFVFSKAAGELDW